MGLRESALATALGQAVRDYARRRLDYAMWFALGGAFVPLMIFFPVIRSSSGFSQHFWAKPVWISLLTYSDEFLGWGVTPLVGCLCLAAGFSLLRPSQMAGPASDDERHPEPAEVVVALGLLLSPLLVMVLAQTVTSGFTLRYLLALADVGAVGGPVPVAGDRPQE